MEYWIWLRLIKGLGPILEKRLLSYFGSPKLIYNAEKIDLRNVDGIGDVLANTIIFSRSLDKANYILEECYKKDIKLLTYNDPLYPAIAKESLDVPTLLYYRGDIIENIEGVAIVGSRKCSSYGKEIALSAASILAQNNIPVISGMAKGIDSYAHISCLKSGGYTIAFLGNGVDICYPAEHGDLMDGIIENGAVISEYLPGTRPRAEYFPKRNRLISSWSKKILVVEAAERSGALITAEIAKKQGKDIYVPPHEIFSSSGRGSNQLISKGANIYLNPSQLLFNNISETNLANGDHTINSNNYGSSLDSTNQKRIYQDRPPELTPLEEKIVHSINNSAKSIEEISIETHINQYDLIQLLSVMELENKIRAVGGGMYSKMRDFLE